jgi:hypothetical protein
MGHAIREHLLFSGVILTLLLAGATSTSAQTDQRQFQAGVHLAAIDSGEFNESDIGVGGRLSWHPGGLVGIEGELGLFSGDFAGRPAFSRRRIEGLFGITAGPRVGRLRVFAKARPGFVRFNEAPQPFACILIFPPPLSCAMAGGETVGAIDLGGGAEWSIGRNALRIDVGDRMMRYPGPALSSDRTAHEESFFGHDLRVAIGAGFGF